MINLDRAARALDVLRSFRSFLRSVLIGLALSAPWSVAWVIIYSNRSGGMVSSENALFLILTLSFVVSVAGNIMLGAWCVLIEFWPRLLSVPTIRLATYAFLGISLSLAIVYVVAGVSFILAIGTGKISGIGDVFHFEQICASLFEMASVVVLAVIAAVTIIALLRVPKSQLMLLQEGLGILPFLGAPQALKEFASIRPGTGLIFAGAATFDVFATVVLFGVLFGTIDYPVTALLTLGRGDAMNETVIWLKWLVLSVGIPAVVLVSIFAAQRLNPIGRDRLRVTAATAMSVDRRPPIVFLRAFKDDQCHLRSRGWLPILAGAKPLDHVLVEEFAQHGPLVALGKPGEVTPPFGVWRTYLHDATDGRWKREVIEYCTRARAIIMVADDKEGVAWELALLGRPDLAPKTIILAAPRFKSQTDNSQLWSHVRRATKNTELAIAEQGTMVVGVFQRQAGTTVLSASQLELSAYILALRMFFAGDLTGPEPAER